MSKNEDFIRVDLPKGESDRWIADMLADPNDIEPKPIIYIAGKVTGTPIAECTMKFGIAQKMWEAKGHDVLNPLVLVNDWHATWESAMRICLAAISVAQEAYFLSDWQDSKGARLEHTICQALGMKIHYEVPPKSTK